MVTRCPRCGSRSTGQVGTEQFYCWECCVEWSPTPGGEVRVFELDEEGELILVDGPYEAGGGA